MRKMPLTVLRALLTKGNWHAFSHLVSIDSFEEHEFRKMYRHITELHERTDRDIDPDSVALYLETVYPTKPEPLAEMLGVLGQMRELRVPDPDLLKSLMTTFVQGSLSNELAGYILRNAGKDGFSIEVVADLAAKAVEVGGRINTTVHDLLEAPLSGSPDSATTRYSLGISSELDLGLRGGVGAGELAFYLAGPSGGKTAHLCASGAAHVKAGRGVLHVTLEIAKRKVFERYDQAWTALDQDELQTAQGQELVAEARQSVHANGGHLWVIDLSYIDVSPNDIGRLIRELQYQLCAGCGKPKKVDTVIIDYLELMQPNQMPGKERRFDFTKIAQQARALARSLDIPILTAWQANRAAEGEEVLKRSHVSECWDIIKIADIILGLNSSPSMKEVKRLRLNILKQRESTHLGIYELYDDMDRMVMRDITHEDHVAAVEDLVGPPREVKAPPIPDQTLDEMGF